ncbi:putative Isoamyl acetate-hydrolyzing esterase 1-like protein [Hypsibius exemplaris]|uniref:Isoamyl acetate-hydrolyzing esterase 1-like protein n=1 Tax=Hypsibius exemplaris TaxID=2072580 RepID=A0A1W0WK28_HYPEX|nr:putative Isoamyl acetate-hydrolyzing esterase 1-like protein [Hypsibius exemplaris]
MLTFQRSFADGSGLGAIIADKLQRRCDVVNRGFSGYNTNLAKIILPQVFTKENLENVAGMVIMLGSNDAALKEDFKLNQHVPLVEYRKNLEDIVSYLTAHGLPKERIILVSPPPIDYDRWNVVCATELGRAFERANIDQYAHAVYEVAKAQGTLFGDLYERMTTGRDWKSDLNDGLHLGRGGAAVFVDVLWPIIERLLKPYPQVYPTWTDIDFRNPSLPPYLQLSFSEGCALGATLADKLQRRCDVVNRGFAGYNTNLAKLILPQVFTNETLENVAGMIIMFGSNDSALKEDHEWNMHVPLAEYWEN